MTATDIIALTANIHDPLARAALADWLEEIGDDAAADMVRTMYEDLLTLLEARRILAEVGHVRCCTLAVRTGGCWAWSDYRPMKRHLRPTEWLVLPCIAYYEDIAGGDSAWLARLFRRLEEKDRRGIAQPGGAALESAALAFFGMERMAFRRFPAPYLEMCR